MLRAVQSRQTLFALPECTLLEQRGIWRSVLFWTSQHTRWISRVSGYLLFQESQWSVFFIIISSLFNVSLLCLLPPSVPGFAVRP